MADIATLYQDQTLIIRISDTVHASAMGAMCVNLVEILSEAERSDDVRSLVLAGEQGFLPNPDQLAAADATATEAWLESWHGLMEAVDTCAKPVLAVLEGEVSAAGLALALTCDRMIVSRSTRLQPAGAEAALTAGLSWHLGRRLPPSLASQLLLGTSARISAEQFLHAGLAAMLADAGSALDYAMAEATHLNAQAPQSVQLARELLRQAPAQSLHAQLEAERRLFWKWQRQGPAR